MTKFEKVKKIFTEFAVNHTDARVSVTIKEDCNICNLILISVKCSFDKHIQDTVYSILFSANKRHPSKGLLCAMHGIDYIIKDLYVESLSVKALENLIDSILDAAVWEIDAKLNTEREYQRLGI